MVPQVNDLFFFFFFFFPSCPCLKLICFSFISILVKKKKKKIITPYGQSSTSSRGFSLISPCQLDKSWKIIIPCFSAWLSCLAGKPQGVTVSMDSVVLCGLWLSSSVAMARKDKKSFKTRKKLRQEG